MSQFSHPATSDVRVNATLPDEQTLASSRRSIAMRSTGEAVVVWQSFGQDGDAEGIYARLLDAAGQPQGSDILVNQITGGKQQNAALAIDALGNFVVVWENFTLAAGSDIVARRFNADGTPNGDQFLINVPDDALYDQQFPNIAMSADGNFVVTWTSNNQDAIDSEEEGSLGVYARRFDPAGTPISGEIRINNTTVDDQQEASVAIAADGSFVVAWTSQGQVDGADVFLRRFRSNGTPIDGADVVVNQQTIGQQQDVSMAIAPDGSFVVAWSSTGGLVLARQFNVDGTPKANEFLVADVDNARPVPSVAIDPQGGFVITWTRTNTQGNDDIFAKRFNAAGVAQEQAFQVNATAAGNQRNAAIAIDADGDAAIVWMDVEATDVETRRFNLGDLPTTTGIPNSTQVDTAPDLTIDLKPLFADRQTPAANLTYSVMEVSNSTLFEVGAPSIGSNGILTLDFVQQIWGESNVTIRATDADGFSVETTFKVTRTASGAPPIVTPITDAISYVENASPTQLDPTLEITDADSNDLVSATVTIVNPQVGDQFSVDSALAQGLGLTVTSSSNGLTITGLATVEQYQSVLRTLAYSSSSENPIEGDRTVRLQVNDGALSSNIATWTVTVSAVNDAPAVSIATAPLTYTEGNAAVAIDPLLTVADIDNPRLDRATVTIATNFAADQDELSVDTDLAASIGLTVTNAGGVLTLSGQATIAQYQTVLRTVAYRNTSSNPTLGDRTIRIVVRDEAQAESELRDRTIQVAPVNAAPVVTLSNSPIAFTEDQAAISIASGLGITDDGSTLTGAIVEITNLAAGDLLEVAIANGSSVSQTLNNGVLTLSGTASLAEYQTILRSLTFRNSNQNPTGGDRTIRIQVRDSLARFSDAVDRTIAVTPVNDAPVVRPSGSVSYTENDLPVAIASDLQISDVDSTTISSATIRLTNVVPGEDELAFTANYGITGSSSGGTLSLSGTATIAQYEEVLRSVTYFNSSDNPDPTTRSIAFQVNDGSDISTVITRTVTVAARNDAPRLTFNSPVPTYTENAAAIAVDANLTLSDPDSTTIRSATIEITNAVSGDFLDATVPGGLQKTFANGVLTIIGDATIAQYQAMLRSITFRNSSDNPDATPRILRFTVSDGDSTSVDRTVNVAPVNDAPIVTPSIGAANFTEGGSPAIVDANLAVSDIDSLTIASATVTIRNFQAGQDVLSAIEASGITSSYSNGVLTLTGVATIAQYEAVLRSVAYSNTSSNPNTASRILEFKVNDGEADSAIRTRTVNVFAANGAPTIAISDSARTFVENNSAVAIAPNLVVSDSDSTTLTGATVTLLNVAVGDALNFTNQNGITGSFTNGVLTLTGSASIANYQAALRSITYSNSSENPDSTRRTVEFRVTDGGSSGIPASQFVQVQAVNDAPTIAGSSGAIVYQENNPGLVIDGNLRLADVDNLTLSGAIVRISSNYAAGQDVLRFTNQNGITGTFADGVLTLSGTASLADYETALRSITYSNSSENPTPSDRTIEFEISDGEFSATSRRTIRVSSTPDAPIVSVSSTPLSYSEGQDAIAVDDAIDLDDVDSPTLQSATVRIVNVAAGDALNFTAPDGFSSSFSNGTLTITGAGSIEQYETLLRSITYRNTSANPSATPRSIEFVVSDGALSSQPQTRTITLTTTNSPPVLTASAATSSYRENAAGVAIDSGLTLTDPDSSTIDRATVTIANSLAEDVLTFTNQAGITGTYSNGVLTLTGRATVAQYQAALRSITYSNASENPNSANRTIAIVVNDGSQDSNTIERTVTIVPVNDAPIVTTSTGTAVFTEDGSAVVIDSGLALADADSLTIDRATVTISNFVEGQDILSFTNSGAISSSFNAQSGVLTFSGRASIADYQAALQQVAYRNTSQNPNQRDRIITFTATDTGQATSLTATRRLTLDTLNSPPVIAPATGAITYAENAPAIAIAPNLTLTDSDSRTIDRATVRLNDFNAEDVLSFTNQNGIAGSFSNGVLTLSGTASIAQYQTALRSITYRTLSDTPIETARAIEIVVNDGTRDSAPVTRSLTIRPTNDAPIVTATAGNTAYSGEAVAIDPTLTIRDPDSANLSGATVRIRNYFRLSQDQLSFTPQNGITGSFDSNTGILRFSGVAAVSDYQTVLRSITYRSLTTLPIAGDRAIEFSVSDGQASSAIAVRTVQFNRSTSTPQAPQITLASAPLTYTENQTGVAIDPALTLRDADGSPIARATVRIVGNVASEDLLEFQNRNGITGSFDSTTGTLTLRGSASIAQYEAALRSITYLNRSDNPNAADRSIELTVSDDRFTSTPVTRSLRVVAVNDAPTISLASEPIVFAPSTGAAPIAAGVLLSDVDSATLRGATVTIEGFTTQDQLRFTSQNGITGSFNNGVLTLSGQATIAQYQTALQSIVYSNSAPNGATRTLQIQVTDGTTPSEIVSRPLRAVTNNRSPVLDLNGTPAGTGFSALYRLGSPPVRIVSPQLSLQDVDSPTIAFAVVAIANPLDWLGERLDAVTAGTGIAAEYNSAGGRLTLIGVASRSTYEQVLRSITYRHSSDAVDVTPRQIVFTVNDGDFSSNVATSLVSFGERLPQGTPEIDSLVTTPNTDSIDALASSDTVTSTLAHLQQNDSINGGEGNDTLVITDGGGDLVLDLNSAANQLRGAIASGTRIFNFERFDLRQFGGSTTQTGSSRDDVLIGAIGSNRFAAGAGNDVILGNVGDDVLDGGSGSDTLTGGAGNDLYRVDNSGDRLIEAANAGIDSIEASISYSLDSDLENLTLIEQAASGTGNEANNQIVGNALRNTIAGGAGRDTLIGNSGNDRLIGDAGDDLLNGGDGRDRLMGGTGSDTFALGLSRRSRDRLLDFNQAADTIAVSVGRVRGMKMGSLSRQQFAFGRAASDASDRFIYNLGNGALFYDADGLGGRAAVQIATIANRSRLAAADIVITA
ncbi:calcium-binding protein [Microcoleus sp. FACHB-1515]|uniref:calcium-binding protein n=1 Tax=Cyanophyceae TaxID=3028117 RepID=UPI00168A1C56|nr:calcium-binding protein [Microcoleus sp. FACHB-1515]MBD2092918.1 calcium-binding protein [Microcoleus sp. FACHB-1515]